MVYIATNGRLLKPELADRLGDAGASAFNFAMDAWDLKPGLPKALVPARKNLEYILRKQYVGSEIVRRLALNPLIASEIKAAAAKDRRDSAVSPNNYSLELIGEGDVRSYHCYVLRAIPKRVDKYLFEGKVWIDKQDFAVVRDFQMAARKIPGVRALKLRRYDRSFQPPSAEKSGVVRCGV